MEPHQSAETRLVFVKRLFQAADAACRRAADIGLFEQAVLLLAFECPDGMGLKGMEARFAGLAAARARIEALADVELLIRVRSGKDRRAFAFVAGERGRSRIEMADEALATLLVEGPSGLDERSFELLVDRLLDAFPYEAELDESLWQPFFSAQSLVVLLRAQDVLERLGDESGLSSFQAALLSAVSASDAKPADLGFIAEALEVSTDLLDFQSQRLEARGLLVFDGGMSLTDEGARRLSRLASGFEAWWNAEASFLDEQRRACFDDAALSLAYWLSTSRAGYSSRFSDSSRSDASSDAFGFEEARLSTAEGLAGFSRLFARLGELFSYPGRRAALTMCSKAHLQELLRLARELGIGGAILDASFERALSQEGPEASSADAVRAEYTRLFLGFPRLISLEGSKWIRGKEEDARRSGERYAVQRAYREVGLKNKDEVKDPADHLASELDYVSYVMMAEAQAWDGGDVTNALEWRRLRGGFIRDHLASFAEGVAREASRQSTNELIGLYAALLDAAVKKALR